MNERVDAIGETYPGGGEKGGSLEARRRRGGGEGELVNWRLLRAARALVVVVAHGTSSARGRTGENAAREHILAGSCGGQGTPTVSGIAGQQSRRAGKQQVPRSRQVCS